MSAVPHGSGVASMIGSLQHLQMRGEHLNDRSADPAVLHALASHGYT